MTSRAGPDDGAGWFAPASILAMFASRKNEQIKVVSRIRIDAVGADAPAVPRVLE
jgi:hypothetical protein